MKYNIFTPEQWKLLSVDNNPYDAPLTIDQYDFDSVEGLSMILRRDWWRLKRFHNLRGRMSELTCEERDSNHFMMMREIELIRKRKKRLLTLLQAKLN